MNEKTPSHYLQERLPEDLTGQVDVVTPAQEQLEAARRLIADAERTLDRIQKAVTAEGKHGETLDETVDQAVAGYVGDGLRECTDDDCRTSVASVGIVEAAKPSDQPHTAKRLNKLLDSGDDDVARAFEQSMNDAQQAGVDVGEVMRDMDDAQRERMGKDELKRLYDMARAYVWDDEMKKPVLDGKVVRGRKASLVSWSKEQAATVVNDPQSCEDEELLSVLEGSVFDDVEEIEKKKRGIMKTEELLGKATDASHKKRLQAALVRMNMSLMALLEREGQVDTTLAQQRISHVLQQRAFEEFDDELQRSGEELREAIHARMESNRYPWTMPGGTIDESVMRHMRQDYDDLILKPKSASGEGMIRIPGIYSHEEDQSFIERHGIHEKTGNAARGSRMFDRSELRDNGIFFVNTVGEAEQPIFGKRIVDDQGAFDPASRVLLTREEFERVYNYQQRRGYGIGELDPDDVVMDMIAANQVRTTRKYNLIGNERISKYGMTSSVFVDGSADGLPGSFGGHVSIDGEEYRVSAVQANLINGSRHYPGVSEMYDEALVMGDQRYMTAGDYVRWMYSAPPTEEEAFYAIKTGLSTRREREWVGSPIELIEI